MALVKQKPTSPGKRFQVNIKSDEVSSKKSYPLKSLSKGVVGSMGRSKGKVSVRHREGGAKKKYRLIDFIRDKENVEAKVVKIEYDPNRTANIALLYYRDGDKSYIIAPSGLKVGQTVVSGEKSPIQVGNALKLKYIPEGAVIHNIEMIPGRGAQFGRSAGSGVVLLSKEGDYANLKMPSGEVRRVSVKSRAVIGQVGNTDHKNVKLGKAGRKRKLGWRPSVRGVAMHPGAHPHGGGEGKSGIGMPSPKSPWGKKTLGKKTKRRKISDKYIVRKGKK